jgi:hypothetical protein
LISRLTGSSASWWVVWLVPVAAGWSGHRAGCVELGYEVGGQGLDGFADFQQPDADSVEYQAVGHIASLQVGADGIDGGLDVGQSLPVPVGHRATRRRICRSRSPMVSDIALPPFSWGGGSSA